MSLKSKALRLFCHLIVALAVALAPIPSWPFVYDVFKILEVAPGQVWQYVRVDNPWNREVLSTDTVLETKGLYVKYADHMGIVHYTHKYYFILDSERIK